MRVPRAATVAPIPQLSPSVYQALLRCRARAAWAAHGDRAAVPLLPKALLGTCFHAAVEQANLGRLSGLGREEHLEAARNIFDRRARTVYAQAHPLLRTKFGSPEKLPYYNLYRERAAIEAADSAERIKPAGGPHDGELTQPIRVAVEERLVSTDGLIVGRPDFIDAVAHEVVDYKTGLGQDDALSEMSEAEICQLRLYVHLAVENGISISRAVIARSNGQRTSINISQEEAAEEGRRAREALAEYNSRAGEPFDIAAQPSVENCQFCPCIPFCDGFWRSATPDWAERCGTHVEGRIGAVEGSTVQELTLVTLRVDAQRGTVPTGEMYVEQIPEAWTNADGSDRPREGDIVRVVYGRIVSETPPQVMRVDRTATSVWSVAASRSDTA
jgi:hypothetical protein